MDIAVVFQLTAAWSHVRQETNGEGIKLLKINWVSTSDTCIHHSQRHLQTQSLLCCMTIGFSQTASMAYVPRPFVDPARRMPFTMDTGPEAVAADHRIWSVPAYIATHPPSLVISSDGLNMKFLLLILAMLV